MTKPGWQVRRIRWCSVFWCSFWFWEGARGPSNQRNSLLLNVSPQFGEVVHLAVVGDEDRRLFVGHWYAAAGGKIQYGEPSTAGADVGTVGKALLPQAGIVRSAVSLDVGHAAQHFPVPTIHQAANSAHQGASGSWMAMYECKWDSPDAAQQLPKHYLCAAECCDHFHAVVTMSSSE